MMGQPSPYLTIAFPNHPPQDQEALDLEGLSPTEAGRLEASLPAAPAPHHVPQPEAPRPQVADAHLPHPHPAGAVSRRSLHPHRPRSVRRLPLDGQPVEVAVPDARHADADLRRAGGTRLRHVHAHVREAGRRAEAGRAVALLRAALRGVGAATRSARCGSCTNTWGSAGSRRCGRELEEYLARNKDYRTNRYELAPEVRAEITRRWGDVIRRYGYETE